MSNELLTGPFRQFFADTYAAAFTNLSPYLSSANGMIDRDAVTFRNFRTDGGVAPEMKTL